MQINIFQVGLTAVVAALLTWLVIQFFHSSSEDASPEETLLGNVKVKTMPSAAKLDEYAKRTSGYLVAAIALTAPVLVVALFVRFAPGVLPAWLESPWLQAILITPVMFHCGASVLREGWDALSNHIPGRPVLISLSILASYIYSLVFCVASGLLPDNSHPYFEVTGIIVALSLLTDLLQATILRFHLFAPQTEHQLNHSEACELNKFAKFIRIFVIVSLCAAIWCFAILLMFGAQPRLATALIATVGLLLITGLLLSAYAIWKLAREQKADNA